MVQIKSGHVFTLLALFWCAWIYTEVTERIDDKEKWSYVEEFVMRGDRFTKADGDVLRAELSHLKVRVRHLEQKLHPNYPRNLIDEN